MTITENPPQTAAAPPELRDVDAPEIGQLRPAYLVKVGWHVRVDGRWLLVVRAGTTAQAQEGPPLSFEGGAMLTCDRGAALWTRDPAEQIAFITSVLPARDHYRPSRPLGTLFGGSASSPLVD